VEILVGNRAEADIMHLQKQEISSLFLLSIPVFGGMAAKGSQKSGQSD